MTGKKNGNKLASTLKNEHDTITEIVKTVLTESDVLQQTIESEKFLERNPQNKNLNTILGELKSDTKFLDSIASRVSDYILNNETFKQIICDSLSIEMKDEIQQLKKEISTIEKQNDDLEIQIESQQQYSRRNCLLIHGLPPHSPNPNENTDQAVIEFFNTHLGIAVMKKDLDRSHRLHNTNSPIIVKFVHHNLKNIIFNSKKKLKGKNIFITESLTPKRMSCMKKLGILRKSKLVHSFWSSDGKIYYTLTENPARKIELNHNNPGKIFENIQQ